ncbi:hypothetical protein Leryth_017634 [Lithospermum erythrorhizon]|nr:hypothetical protein Leryth_017634 [Lithospermum erythrorhizon]
MINDCLCCYSDLDGKMLAVFDFVSQKFPLAVGFVRSMSSPVEECNIQKDDTSSEIIGHEALKRLVTFLDSDEMPSPSEIHITCQIEATMEAFLRELNNNQNTITNVAPIRRSKPWVLVISVVIWIRVMLKKNTSTKRDCPQHETSTVAKKKRMC